jgi:TPR repeat protein
MYANGRGVPKDDTEAIRYWRLAAGQGLAVAQYYLGNMYARGRGVPQSYIESAKWYLLAAEQGYPDSQLALGKIYQGGGGGLAVDLVQAHKWYNLAAARFPPGKARSDAAGYRDALARGMSAWQLNEAQRLALEWQPHTQGP